MELLQRYVDNVKSYLPAATREDIGNELLADLQDAYDELADSRGRAPGEEEIAALLKRRGHPMQVAAGYRPQRTLVSETLFPLYTQVLKWTLLAILIGTGAVALLELIHQPEPRFLGAAIGWLGSSFNGAIYAFAWVTLGFYLAGEGLSLRDVFAKWDPRNLPRITAPGQRIRAFDSAFEFAATLLALAWLNDLAPVTRSISDVGVSLVLSDALKAMLPWLNLGLAASLLMSLDKLFFPYWTRNKLILDTAINSFWLFLCVKLMALPAAFAVLWNGGETNWQISPTHWRMAIGVILAITCWDLIRDLQRLWQARATQARANRVGERDYP